MLSLNNYTVYELDSLAAQEEEYRLEQIASLVREYNIVERYQQVIDACPPFDELRLVLLWLDGIYAPYHPLGYPYNEYMPILFKEIGERLLPRDGVIDNTRGRVTRPLTASSKFRNRSSISYVSQPLVESIVWIIRSVLIDNTSIVNTLFPVMLHYIEQNMTCLSHYDHPRLPTDVLMYSDNVVVTIPAQDLPYQQDAVKDKLTNYYQCNYATHSKTKSLALIETNGPCWQWFQRTNKDLYYRAEHLTGEVIRMKIARTALHAKGIIDEVNYYVDKLGYRSLLSIKDIKQFSMARIADRQIALLAYYSRSFQTLANE